MLDSGRSSKQWPYGEDGNEFGNHSSWQTLRCLALACLGYVSRPSRKVAYSSGHVGRHVPPEKMHPCRFLDFSFDRLSSHHRMLWQILYVGGYAPERYFCRALSIVVWFTNTSLRWNVYNELEGSLSACCKLALPVSVICRLCFLNMLRFLSCHEHHSCVGRGRQFRYKAVSRFAVSSQCWTKQ